jgi:hypothetical protein
MAGQRKSGRIAHAAAKLVSRLCIAFYTGQLPTGNCPVLLQAFACGVLLLQIAVCGSFIWVIAK